MTDLRDRRTSVLFVGLFVALMVVAVVIAFTSATGPVARVVAIVVGSAVASMLAWILLKIYQRLRDPRQEVRATHMRAGEVPCPSCGSLQTDEEVEVRPDGHEELVWRCFACEERWERVAQQG